MALITTPGAADADSFVSLADCDTYCEAQGLTDWTSVGASPPEPREAALRRATTHLSTGYGWKGTKVNGRSQALAWPRSGVEDGDGDAVDADTIPSEIIAATCIIAAKELQTPGYMSPAVVLTDRVKRERVGELETEYVTATNTPDAARPVLLQIGDLVGGLIASGTNALVGTAIRS